MERRFTFQPGEYYHIYNRGVDKGQIFFGDGDQRQFQRLLYLRNSSGGHISSSRTSKRRLAEISRGEPLVDICAYALMPNHFHLLLHERGEGNISKFMGKFSTAFSLYVNKKHERTGPLMCRPFRARLIDSDEYFRYLISYIHLNPLDLHDPDWKEKGMGDLTQAADFLRSYQYSSYYDFFTGDRDETLILNKGALPMWIGDLEDVAAMTGVLKYSETPSEQ